MFRLTLGFNSIEAGPGAGLVAAPPRPERRERALGHTGARTTAQRAEATREESEGDRSHRGAAAVLGALQYSVCSAGALQVYVILIMKKSLVYL